MGREAHDSSAPAEGLPVLCGEQAPQFISEKLTKAEVFKELVHYTGQECQARFWVQNLLRQEVHWVISQPRPASQSGHKKEERPEGRRMARATSPLTVWRCVYTTIPMAI